MALQAIVSLLKIQLNDHEAFHNMEVLERMNKFLQNNDIINNIATKQKLL